MTLRATRFVGSLSRAATTSLAALAAMACGGLSDGNEATPIATLAGSLASGSAPNGAHVAIVFRKGATGPLVVTHDVALEGGRFSVELEGPPADELFVAESELSPPLGTPGTGSSEAPSSGTGGSPGNGGTAPAPTPVDASAPVPHTTDAGVPPPPNDGGTSGAKVLSSRRLADTVSGGVVSDVLRVAVAGFVVYADANGNGKLDVEADGTTPDTLLGGSRELTLAYLRGGTTLAYEKLRDKAGQLPRRGYNLVWDQGRFLPLSAVELELRPDVELPLVVCGSAGIPAPPDAGTGPAGSTSGGSGTVDAGTGDPSTSAYPSPSDPGLVCSADGLSFSYSSCASPPSTGASLCASAVGGGCSGYGVALPVFENGSIEIPPGWPCPVATDAGPAPSPTR